MKGIQDYYGKDKIEYVLVNSNGHDKKSIAGADSCIERYDMQAFDRIRLDQKEFRNLITRAFGLFGYGQIIIDKNGILRYVGSQKAEHMTLSLLDKQGTMDGFSVAGSIKDQKGGRGFLDSSKTLTNAVSANIQVTLKVPEGWYVQGGIVTDSAIATSVTVKYQGKVKTESAVFPGGGNGKASKHPGGITVTIPVRVAKGAVTGRYPIHGVISFQACNSETCLPPMELPWSVVINAR